MNRPTHEGLLGLLPGLIPHLACVVDHEGVVLDANAAWQPLMENPVGRRISDLVLPEDADLAMGAFMGRREADPHVSMILRMGVGDAVRRFRWSVSLDPDTGYRFAVAWDVTERERALAHQRAALRSAPTPVLLVDTDGRILLANPAALALVGYEDDGLVGKPVELLVPPQARDGHRRLRAVFNGSSEDRPMGHGRDLWAVRRDGAQVPVEIGLKTVEVDGRVLTVVSLLDLTDRVRSRERIEALATELTSANEQLERLAGTDPLTGLWNRRKFFEEARRILGVLQQTGDPFSVILLDVDDFKAFNDRFGHLVGDQALREVAAVLGDLRGASDFVARYGGEEFIVGLPGAERTGARVAAERLREGVSLLRSRGTDLTISAGVATLEDPGERGVPIEPLLETVIEAADRALYESKASGKNRVT